MLIGLPVLTVPVNTLSPAFLIIGRDSPVKELSSNVESPKRTVPSAGGEAPQRTRTRSPTSRRSTSIFSTLVVGRDDWLSSKESSESGLDLTSRASIGLSFPSIATASPALALLYASK